MSRKAFADKSSWKTPSVYAFVGGYGPFRARQHDSIEDVVVLLYKGNGEQVRRHPMYGLAKEAQHVLLKYQDDTTGTMPISNGILVVDVRDMFDNQDEMDLALKNETEHEDAAGDMSSTKKRSEKGICRLLTRLFKRMCLHRVVLTANGELCALALKLHTILLQTDPEMIAGLRLVFPRLSAKFINTYMVDANGTANASRKAGKTAKNHKKKDKMAPDLVTGVHLDLVAEEEDARVDMLRHSFPQLRVFISESNRSTGVLGMGQEDEGDYDFDPEYCNALGKSLFLSSMAVEMNRHTKQYERLCEPITDSLSEIMELEAKKHIQTEEINWDECERQIGALVLRGNRCVLVRSSEWAGMRIPYVATDSREMPVQAAIRAFVELAEVDATEVRELKNVVPVSIYAPSDRPILVQLYALYATSPPPDGPLEDADIEDEEDPYDWYTFPNAIKRLDAASSAALRTMAFNLVSAANVGLVPTKFGGIFGQELVTN